MDSWVDVIAVEYESLLRMYPFNDQLSVFSDKPAIHLLDVGCGSAIFPSYLDKVLSNGIKVSCDLLDISESSLQKASRILDELDHLSVRRSFQLQIEDIPAGLSPDQGTYDVIWAIHSFTTVDVERMPNVYAHLIGLLNPGGFFFVYQLTAESTYQILHRTFLELYPSDEGQRPYMEYEDSKKILDSLGVAYQVYELDFKHEIHEKRTDLLEKYLRKCILDDSADVLEIFRMSLDAFHDPERMTYQFPQSVNFVVVRSDV